MHQLNAIPVTRKRMSIRVDWAHSVSSAITPAAGNTGSSIMIGKTGFPLKGGHKGLDCLVCHSRPLKGKVSLPGTCVGCHSDDDVHDGRFGEYCERCHTVNDFGQIRHGVGR